MKSQAEVTIYRKPNVVFQHLTDPEKLKRWMIDLVSATSLAELKPCASYSRVIRRSRSTETLLGQIVELSEDQRFSFIFYTPTSLIKVHFEIIPMERQSATTLISTVEKTPVGLLAKLMKPVSLRAMKKEQATELRQLKIFLDRGGDIGHDLRKS